MTRQYIPGVEITVPSPGQARAWMTDPLNTEGMGMALCRATCRNWVMNGGWFDQVNGEWVARPAHRLKDIDGHIATEDQYVGERMNQADVALYRDYAEANRALNATPTSPTLTAGTPVPAFATTSQETTMTILATAPADTQTRMKELLAGEQAALVSYCERMHGGPSSQLTGSADDQVLMALLIAERAARAENLREAQTLAAHWEEQARTSAQQRDFARRDLQSRREAHERDIKLIGERLMQEAADRDWCREYDKVVKELNEELEVELPVRTRDFNITVTLSMSVSEYAGTRDELRQEISNAIPGHYGDVSVDDEDIEIEEA